MRARPQGGYLDGDYGRLLDQLTVVPSGIRTRGLCLERAACWASYTMGTVMDGQNLSIIAYPLNP